MLKKRMKNEDGDGAGADAEDGESGKKKSNKRDRSLVSGISIHNYTFQ